MGSSSRSRHLCLMEHLLSPMEEHTGVPSPRQPQLPWQRTEDSHQSQLPWPRMEEDSNQSQLPWPRMEEDLEERTEEQSQLPWEHMEEHMEDSQPAPCSEGHAF